MKLISKFLLLFSLAIGNLSAEVIKLASGEWAPWLSKNLKEYGVASHIVTEAFKRAGYEVEYGFFPWKRGYEIAKDLWDGTLVWSYQDERADFFEFSDVVITNETVFFHLKELEFDWNTYDDLKGKLVGTTTGYFYGKPFHEALEKKIFNAEEGTSDENNFKLLFNKRIDLYLCDLNVGYYILNKFFADGAFKVNFHPKPTRVVEYHVMLNKINPRNKTRMERFNKALAEMKADGTIQNYLKNSMAGKYEK